MEWVALEDMTDLEAVRYLSFTFKDWICFRAGNTLCCARLLQDPEIIVRGETWADLRDHLLSHPGST